MTSQRNSEFYPVALTIAGSDSGGGAGIQADLRTFAAFGVFGCSAITAVTAQSPLTVTQITGINADSIKSQLETVFETLSIRTVKTGMLHNTETVATVTDALKRNSGPLVVDPVMVSTSKRRLLEKDAVELMKRELLPLASWITPNRYEAELLTGIPLTDEKTMIEAAVYCADKWQCGCVLKAGHFINGGDEFVRDIVAFQQQVFSLSSPVVEWQSPTAAHGTGCTFSAALAAGLALDAHWKDALRDAKAFVFGSLHDTVFIGENIEAMYPPLKSYVNKIKLRQIN